MSSIPRITEEDIREYVGERSFSLGQKYFRQGAVFNARQQGMTLKARCQGSRPDAYRVEVSFDTTGIAGAACSCPVGFHCKHIAALLLAWLHQPEEFLEQQDVDTILEQSSKAELIALIKRMLRRDPDLELLLPIGSRQHAGVNPDVYRRQVRAAFQHGGLEWGAEYEIAEELSGIQEMAYEYVQQQDYVSAVTLFDVLVTGILEHIGEYSDEEGELRGVITGCLDGLDECLAAVQENEELRERIFRILFEIYKYDIEAGGVGVGDEAPDIILRHATAGERRMIAGWVREQLSQAQDNRYDEWGTSWERSQFGHFLLDLEADTLDDETFLHICRETGRIADAVNRLLELGRIDEAASEAKYVNDYVLLGLLNLFVQHGQGELAERLAKERLKAPQNIHNVVDVRLQEWLKQRYLARDDLPAALEISEQMFREHPSLQGYQELRQLATPFDRWETLRQELLALLEEKQHMALLIQIALDEDEIDKALELLGQLFASEKKPAYGYGYFYGYPQLAIEVAQAAEETRPRAAITIYQREAERLIEQRGRDRYQAACGFLLRARALYEKLGEQDAWNSYITNLRDRYRSLRALKEELAAARL